MNIKTSTQLTRARTSARFWRAATALLCASATSACTRGNGGPADSAVNPAPEPAGGAITMWTDSTELFMEHPALIVGAPDKFAVHLTDITDYAPLRSGRITLRFVPRGGGALVEVVQDAPRSPGIYGPSPEFKSPGVYDLTILVDSPQAKDSITVPELRVYANADEAPKESGEEDGGIPFLKEQQWKTPGFRTEFATTGAVAATLEANGEIETAAGRQAIVAAPIAGLVDAGSVARSPMPGQRVSPGQVLANLTPTIADGGSAYAEARARLREAEDEDARAKRLFAVQAVPERRVHEAANRLQAAKEALAGFAGGALSSNGTIAIRAPIGGVVIERQIVPGSRVEAGTPLFTIVDMSTLWLRAHVPAAQGALISGAAGATFQVEGNATLFDTRRMISSGAVIDQASRTIPVLYEVSNTSNAIRVGAVARVQLKTGKRTEGVLIPSSAVLDEDGRAIAYVQVSGERFEKRALTVIGTERGRTAVVAGIKPGERVVTGAAHQVRLASLSTSVPAHGHEH